MGPVLFYIDNFRSAPKRKNKNQKAKNIRGGKQYERRPGSIQVDVTALRRRDAS
jgi:hypothetical protein